MWKLWAGCCALFLTGYGCSETGSCPGTDPFCQADAKAKLEVSPAQTVSVGQQVVFDASESIYEDIRWALNGTSMGKCNHEEFCAWTFSAAGTYEVEIHVKVSPASVFRPVGGSDRKDSASLEMLVR